MAYSSIPESMVELAEAIMDLLGSDGQATNEITPLSLSGGLCSFTYVVWHILFFRSAQIVVPEKGMSCAMF